MRPRVSLEAVSSPKTSGATKVTGLMHAPGLDAGIPATPIRVRIARSDPSAQQTFEVERTNPMMVLDLLLAIQRDHDPTIAFRYSCRVALCGTCTVRVNGRPVLACQKAVSDDWEDIRLEPLSGLPVVRDLIVDMTPFFEEWTRIMPYFVPVGGLAGPALIPPDALERRIIDPARACITCAACYAGCGMVGDRRLFLGPAALIRAMVLIADSRDDAGAERLRAVSAGDGVDGCHYMGTCTAVCPKDLDPAGAIRRLRRWRLTARQ